MNIRPATTEDSASIALLHAESWRSVYRGIFRDEFLDGDVFQERRCVWHSRIAQPKDNQLVLIAEENSELFGFVCAFGNEDKKWGTFIDNLHVHVKQQRQGIGTNLMAEVALWSNQNFPTIGIYLSVLEPNRPAQDFYQFLGATYKESKPWAPPDGGEVIEFLYAWSSVEPLLPENVG